jgi:hypothetical protein
LSVGIKTQKNPMDALETEVRRCVTTIAHGKRWVLGHQYVVSASSSFIESCKLGEPDSLMNDIETNVYEARWVATIGFVKIIHQENVMSFMLLFLNEVKEIHAELCPEQ